MRRYVSSAYAGLVPFAGPLRMTSRPAPAPRDISVTTPRTFVRGGRDENCSDPSDGDSLMTDCQDDSELQKIEESQEEFIALDQDVYGAGVYTIIHDSQVIMSKEHFFEHGCGGGAVDDGFRVGFTICGLIINFVLQIQLLWFTCEFAVMPSVSRLQLIYQEYHSKCFEPSGNFNVTKWNMWDGQEQLCNMVFANSPFLYVMIVLWWMTMIAEIRECERLFRTIHHLRSTTSMKDVFRVVDGEERIERLMCPVRYTLYCVIWLPRLFISCALLVLGTMWLAATHSVQDLILNAIALEFVVEVDKTLFDAMFPATLARHIENAKLSHLKVDLTPLYGYVRSVVWMCLNFGGVAFYLSPLGQRMPLVGVLPQYANDALCPIYWGEQAKRVCSMWDHYNGVQCFPFGEQ